MKPRWAPRWFTYVGLGPNPALPRPVSDSMPKAFYNWIEKDTQKRTSTMNTKDFADIKRMSIIDYLKYDQQEWPAWRKRIAALREEAKASGDQEMVDLCYLADSGEDEDAVATVVQYLDDIAEESEQ